MPITPHQSAKSLALLLPIGVFLTLGGCADIDRMSTSSIPMDDYRNRHPIVLAEGTRRLDLFPAPQLRGLDHRSAAQVVEFGALYRVSGEGPISILLPAVRGEVPRAAVAAIRQALAAGGAHAPLEVSTYPVVNPDLASPIRLSFVGLKSKVADQCGQWPSDLASGSSIQGWANKPYWNFGCSYQSMLAEQVADPRDLVAPRAEDQPDTLMLGRSISEMRKGNDPTTDWKTKNTSISNVGTQ
ncbi:MAG TPA: CpaD family pilus assembly protein [Methylovirgula sp.]|nr:CpaD family pilus assembly protein [Methylovirgula sp.]